MKTNKSTEIATYSSDKGIIVPEDALSKTVEVYLAKPSAAFRWAMSASMLLIVGVCAWAALTTVPVVVKSQGSLRPSTDLQVFRSPRSAVVELLLVQENTFVQAGDTLAVLQHDNDKVRRELLQLEHDQLQQDKHDMELMLDMLPDSVGESVSWEKGNFKRPNSVSQMQLVRKDLELLNSQRSRLLQQEERTTSLSQQHFASADELEAIQHQRRLKEVEILQYLLDQRQRWSSILFEATRSLTKVRQELAATDKSIAQAMLIANIAGHITGNVIDKEGVFVQEGSVLFSITPEQEIVAELLVAPRDIGHIRIGHTALLHFETFSFSEWGAAESSVTQIGSDIQYEQSSNRTFYKVVCQLKHNQLYYKRSEAKTAVTLKKGLPLQAHIQIAEKTVFELLYNRTVDYLQL